MTDTEKGIDYRAVLSDLEARRAALDAAIAGIRQMLGHAPEPGLVLSNGKPGTSFQGEPEDVRHDSFFGLPIADATKKYLRMVKNTQSTGQICDALLRGGLKTTSQNIQTTVHSVLSRQAERDGAEIVKVKRGQWGLAEWYPGMRRDRRSRGMADKLIDDVVQGKSVDDAIESAVNDAEQD